MSTTFFDTAKRNFKDVPIGEGQEIATTEFLEAAESLVGLFDILGSTAFAPVKSDMNGNIKKIRDRQLSHPADGATLQSLTKAELAAKSKTATEGLLWLNRGLAFTALALRNNVSDSNKELSASFKGSYEQTLKKHHNFAIRPIFSLAMNACPSRNDFYKKLGDDQAKVQSQLSEWLGALEERVAILDRYYEGIKF